MVAVRDVGEGARRGVASGTEVRLTLEELRLLLERGQRLKRESERAVADATTAARLSASTIARTRQLVRDARATVRR